MKIEPIYLLAPEPDRRVKLSRRAFASAMLGAAAAGAVGGGWVVATVLGSTPSATPSPTPGSDTTHLDWVLSFEHASLTPLFENAATLLFVAGQHPANPALRRVVRRVAETACENRNLPNRAIVARSLLALQESQGVGLVDTELRRRLATTAQR